MVLTSDYRCAFEYDVEYLKTGSSISPFHLPLEKEVFVAQKLHTKVAHVEGGIRSNDWTMPEEINRLVTDAITNYFYTTSEVANANLRASGVADEKIVFVGNTMIDTLLKQMPRFKQPALWNDLGLKEKEFVIMTLHRPANVDGEQQLKALLEEIITHSADLPLIFPVHPRTAKMIKELGISHPRLHLLFSLEDLAHWMSFLKQ